MSSSKPTIATAAEVPAARTATTLNVLMIVGHPRKASFCGALARAYRKGAARAGVDLRELWLANLRFDRDVRSFSPDLQAVEKDLRRARDWIAWADQEPSECLRAGPIGQLRTRSGPFLHPLDASPKKKPPGFPQRASQWCDSQP